MFKSIIDKFAPYAPLIIRVLVGIVFLSHGLQKRANPAGVAGYFGFLGLPIPAVLGWFITLLETIGGALLILGVATRWVAELFVIEMLVATVLAKLTKGVPLVTDYASRANGGLRIGSGLAGCLSGIGGAGVGHRLD
jgi:putative oxidoreductase